MAQKKVAVSRKLVVIGGSAGSLGVLLRILPALNKLDYAIVIVLHRKAAADTTLTNLLSTRTTMKVKEIEEKEYLQPGCIYIVPPDYHVLFEKDHSFTLDDSEKINFSRPSIDVVFQSAADVFAPLLACVLLSGANADGTEGLRHVKAMRGITIAQLPSESDVAYMPAQAIQNDVVDHIMDTAQMISFINVF